MNEHRFQEHVISGQLICVDCGYVKPHFSGNPICEKRNKQTPMSSDKMLEDKYIELGGEHVKAMEKIHNLTEQVKVMEEALDTITVLYSNDDVMCAENGLIKDIRPAAMELVASKALSEIKRMRE